MSQQQGHQIRDLADEAGQIARQHPGYVLAGLIAATQEFRRQSKVDRFINDGAWVMAAIEVFKFLRRRGIFRLLEIQVAIFFVVSFLLWAALFWGRQLEGLTPVPWWTILLPLPVGAAYLFLRRVFARPQGNHQAVPAPTWGPTQPLGTDHPALRRGTGNTRDTTKPPWFDQMNQAITDVRDHGRGRSAW